MKKGKISLSVILFTIVMLVTGCGKVNAVTDFNSPKDAAGTIQWNVSHSSMLEQYEAAAIRDGKIYAYKYGEDGINISVFVTDTVRQVASYEIPGVIEVKSISINASGLICLFGSTKNGNALWQVESNGDIGIIEGIEVENLGELPVLKNFYADNNGYYYIWYEMSVPCAEVYENGEEDIYTRLDRIYVKDQQMNTIIYEEVPDSYNNKLLSFAFDENGIPVFLAKDEEGYYVQEIRTTNREEYKPRRLETGELMNLEGDSVIAYTQDGLLYIREGSLHLYHMSEARDEKLLELASVGILEEDIIYLGKNGSTIEIIDNYKEFGWSEYTTIVEGNSQKIQLTLGVMTLQPAMRDLIASFNRYQNEVTIEPVIYAEDKDYDAGYEKLTLDIIQGKGPDLISVYGLESENLAKIGAFCDLYMFMQEDEELKEENFVSSVLHAYEIEGNLYTIAPTFRIYTMWGGSSMVEGKKGVNWEKMIQMLQNHGGDINSIYGFSADENVLTTLCALNMDKFIDWSGRSCDFTGDEFKQIVDFAKQYEGKSFESLYTAIQNGDILLTLGLITSVEDYRLESELYGENVQFIGYPTESGTGTATLFSGDELAISSGSEYQQEAWSFVKYFMKNGYNGQGFPVMKDQFDTVLNETMHEIFINENGEESRVVKKNYREKDIINIQIYKCEPEDVAAIRDLVESISGKFQYHTEIQKIIDEETVAYFQGQKELGVVCETIQNRVLLYVSEE